jgi:hypothetical protein
LRGSARHAGEGWSGGDNVAAAHDLEEMRPGEDEVDPEEEDVFVHDADVAELEGNGANPIGL